MSAVRIKVCNDQGEADEYGIGGLWYQWRPGGCVFPQDVVAVVINLPKATLNSLAFYPISYPTNINEHRLTGQYFNPTLNPCIHWDGSCGHLVNGQLMECPEHHTLETHSKSSNEYSSH